MSDHIYVILKTNYGQEIYAKIKEDMDQGETYLIMRDPMLDQDFVNEDGSTASALIRYTMASSERDVPLIKNCVVSCLPMSSSFIQYYTAAVDLSMLTLQVYEKNIEKTASLMRQSLADASDELDGLTISHTDTNTLH